LLLPHAAATLEVRETAGRALADVVHDFLRERNVLLVLDNFEHLLEAAPLVADLLAAGPMVKVLATSRAPLRVRGEREYPVPPMALPTTEEARDLTALAASEAVAFFVDRAQAVQPDFALTPDNALAVIEICHRLDGLPLALELAASRAKVLPPATLLARLSARLPLLTGGTRDAPGRQRTLRDAISWSYELLSPEARSLFRRLSVFVGGWTLEAAEAVANLEGDREVLEGLAVLADESLIRLDESGGEPRYGMLETIREFAQERLAASGEDAMLRLAHAAYFRALAEHGKPHLYGAGQRTWLRRLEAEHPNFRAALEALIASGDHEAHLRLVSNLGLFWFLHGHFAEGRAHLEQALAHASSPSPECAEALLGIGRLAEAQDDLVAAEAWLRQSEELARSLCLPAVLWQALFQCGGVAEDAGDDERAIPLWESALVVARQLNDPQAASVQLLHLSDAAYRRGDLELAERQGEEAVSAVRLVGDAFVLSLALGNIGQVALAHGDTSRALVAYQEALDLARGIDSDWAITNALAGFAAVAARDDHIAAAQLLGATDTMREASQIVTVSNFAHHAQTLRAVQSALSKAAFAAAWEAGRSLSAEEAVELPRALGLVTTSRVRGMGSASTD
jgi:predicted ATPase